MPTLSIEFCFVFAFYVVPLEGWQPVDIFYSSSPLGFFFFFFFFQVDLLAQLNARIKTLEDAGNDVPAHLSKITSYGFRREEDFDKYDALNMVEQLATAAKLSGHEKASTYDAIACTLREKLPFTKKQFKAYFVALLADKEYAKVLKAVAKVDKSFKSSVPSTASGSTGAPAHASARPPARRPRIYCYACGVPGHTASRCFKRFNNQVTHSRGLAPLCRLLEDNSLFIPPFLSVAFDYTFFPARCA